MHYLQQMSRTSQFNTNVTKAKVHQQENNKTMNINYTNAVISVSFRSCFWATGSAYSHYWLDTTYLICE